MTAQTSTREAIENKKAETKGLLPYVVAKGVMYRQEYISDNSVYEVFEIDENDIPFILLSSRKGTMKKTLLQQYGIEPNLISLAQMVVECNMDIVYRYVSKQSGKAFSITLSTKELSKCLKD